MGLQLEGAAPAAAAAGGSVAPMLRDLSAVKEAHFRLAGEELRSFLAGGETLRFPHSADPLVSVLLVLRNRAELTLRCLRSLSSRLPFEIEVVIVDNASTGDTSRLLGRLRGAVILRNRENTGYPQAVNQAAARARGRFLLLLNNDTELLPGSLSAAVEAMLEEPEVGAVAARILLLDGSLQEAGGIVWSDGAPLGYGRGGDPSAGEYLFRRDVDFGSAAFLLTERALFERLSGFDLDFSPAYYEDIDYCFRLRAAGRRVLYEPRATILHYEFGSSGSMGNALQMQVERRDLFRSKQGAALAGQLAPEAKNVLLARNTRRDQMRVLVFDDRVQHSWLEAGFPRGLDLMRGLVTLGCQVTLYPLSVTAEELGGVHDELPSDVEVMLGWGPERLAPFLEARQGYYDRVLICRERNLRRVRPFFGSFGGAKVLYDAEPSPHAEPALLDGVDVVLAASDQERRMLRRQGARRVRTVRWMLEPDPRPEDLAGRQGALFLGGILESSGPNADALEWLLREIHPELVGLAGRGVPLALTGLRLVSGATEPAAEGVRFLGVVRDPSALLSSARILVAPTGFAGGLPCALLQAAACGLPIVATSPLARQLGWKDGKHLLVADETDAFARACLSLLEDDALWRRLREGALGRVREECSRAGFLQALSEALRFDELGIASATGSLGWPMGRAG